MKEDGDHLRGWGEALVSSWMKTTIDRGVCMDPVTNEKLGLSSTPLFSLYILVDNGDAGAQASTSSFFCFSNHTAPPLQLRCETLSQFRGGVDYKPPYTLVTASRHLICARNYAVPVRLFNARAKRKSGAEQCTPQRADQY